MALPRIRERRGGALAFGRSIGRFLVALLALALVWYGLWTLLLALDIVGASTANLVTGYRTAFDFLAGLTPQDVSGTLVRAIVAGAGLLAFLLFGYAALKELPRPYVARHDVELEADERVHIVVQPGAIESLAEAAALEAPGVASASGTYEEEALGVDVRLRRASGAADTLRDVHRRVRAAVDRADLPSTPVDVTLTGLDRTTRRELS